VVGLLIQAAVGSAGGVGGRRTNRSGVAAEAFSRTRWRSACAAVVDGGRGVQADPGVPVLVVVPVFFRYRNKTGYADLLVMPMFGVKVLLGAGVWSGSSA
jgi:hypothetical protein